MVDRRAVLTGVAGVVAVSGCIGPSGDGGGDGSGDDDGSSSDGDDGSDTDDGGTEDGPAGEVVTEGGRSDAVAVDQSARFEEGNIDEILIVEGSVTNTDSESALSVDLTLGVEQFRREATTTLELGPDESGEFELRLESVYAAQFNGYTLTVTAEQG